MDSSSDSNSKTFKRLRTWGHSLLDTFKRPDGEASFSRRLRTYAVQHGISMLDSPAPSQGARERAVNPSHPQNGQRQQMEKQYAAGSSSPVAANGPTHLIVMANGLFGKPDNWTVIAEHLQEQLDPRQVLLHASQVNRLTETYDGIDVCGQRLADEVQKVVSQNPNLKRISVIGHSMGGLLVRYALGALYNPDTKLIAGLQPCHFVSMATPHMGCDAEGLAQLPFIGWVESLRPLHKVLQSISVPTATVLFKRTGRQFFLADGTPPGLDAGAGTQLPSSLQPQPFSPQQISAGDGSNPQQILDTARPPSSTQLPVQGQPQTTVSTLASYAAFLRGYGAIAGPFVATGAAVAAPKTPERSASLSSSAIEKQEQPLLLQMTADHPDRNLFFLSALQSFASRTCYANTGGDHLVGWANSSLRFMHQLPQLPPEHIKAKGVVLEEPFSAAWDLSMGRQPGPDHATSSADLPLDRTSDLGRSSASNITADQASEMLRRLQSMPWRRIDVCFQGARWGFAHNNIQVTRRWMNFEGVQVAQHLAQQLAALDARLAPTCQSMSGSLPPPLHIVDNSHASSQSVEGMHASPLDVPVSAAHPEQVAGTASPPTKLQRLSYERLQQRDGVSVESNDDAPAVVLLPMHQCQPQTSTNSAAPQHTLHSPEKASSEEFGAVCGGHQTPRTKPTPVTSAQPPSSHMSHFVGGGGSAAAAAALPLPNQNSAPECLENAFKAAIAAVENAGTSMSHVLDKTQLVHTLSAARSDARAAAEQVSGELLQARAAFARASQERMTAAADMARAVKVQAQAKAEAAAVRLARMSQQLDQKSLAAVGHQLSDFFEHAWSEHQRRREMDALLREHGSGSGQDAAAPLAAEQAIVTVAQGSPVCAPEDVLSA